MSLRSRLAIAAAAGVLAASAATPAVAADDWGTGPGSAGHAYGDAAGHDNDEDDTAHDGDDAADDSGAAEATGGTGGTDETGGTGGYGDTAGTGGDGRHQSNRPTRYYKGVVTASTLVLRSAPNRGSRIIRYVHRGDIVKIYCKTGGETVDGNPLWYLLPDGTWAWGAARYIDNIGPAPRWC